MTEPMAELSRGEHALLDRVRDPQYPAWRRQVERVARCSAPIRITGGAAAVDTVTGAVLASTSSADRPDGTLLIACGDRRSAVCPGCAETYRQDAWQVVAAGIRGRDGTAAPSAPPGEDERAAVPDTVDSHPRLWVTLTAPSFGPVHRSGGQAGAPCRPRVRGPQRPCAHAKPARCGLVHDPDHPVVGSPLCAECYDYTGATLWNSHVGTLWRRTRTYVDRELAARLGLTHARARERVRVSYVKVAEWQRRGLVHLHLVMRLDGIDPADRSRIIAPPPEATADVLAAAVEAAVDRAGVPLPPVDGRLRVAQWGAQREIRDVTGSGDAKRLAAYLAKYTTKDAGSSGARGPATALARRLRVLHPQALRRQVGPHLARMVETAWRLGGRSDLAHLRLRHWAHQLGHRGHVTTKSRSFSVTFGALREVRRAWRRRRSRTGANDVWAAAERAGAVVVGAWRYAGSGFVRAVDVDIADAIARDHEIARDEIRRHRRRAARLSEIYGVGEWCPG
jgi:hypothetical protein